MNQWNYIGIRDAGSGGIVYDMIHSSNDIKGVMKIIDSNELLTTTTLISLSNMYDYYIRVLDTQYICTSYDRQDKVWIEWLDNRSIYGKYDMIFGEDDIEHKHCHCVYEELEYINTTTHKDLLIEYTHILIAVYIAMSEVGYVSQDFQWMYRRVPVDKDTYIVTYKDHTFTLPNIGFIPVIMDHGESYISYGCNDTLLYTILSQYYSILFDMECTEDIEDDIYSYIHNAIPSEVTNMHSDNDVYRTSLDMVLKYIHIFMKRIDTL